MSGTLNGRAVVFKWITGEDAADHVRAQQEEAEALFPRMANGPFRVPEPLAFLSGEGLSVMAFAPGRRLSDLVRKAGAAERARLLVLAGGWHRCHTAERRRGAAFGVRYWLRQREVALPKFADGTDRKLARGIQQKLEALAPALRGVPITQARIHGDLTALNLLVDGDVICGVDLQSRAWWPLAKDAARFLVQLTATCPAADGPRLHGIAQADMEAFRASGVLEAEPAHLLPCFIGIELAARLQSPTLAAAPRARTQALARAYLS
ncbi:phosphotransferase family enzyme [Aliiruegeria haliotis]|uniref:Phosphotransferase family enzyme n=1 Tax=Aliiruegeria haliotis TaxID=1280846 RepID=A0A2T0RY99_9RHOB|nr:phosphotransferase [Aliiruegeria haliotis]PRY26137.1 phosphotransferase family enzyme [Aliiruegeria haliotis]